MAILLTGGTGYIGSHTAVELLAAGYDVVLADDLSNSEAAVVDRIGAVTGRRPEFYRGDCAGREYMEQIFSRHEIGAVIHFAGSKAVGESVQRPVEYYRNNLDTTLTVLETMRRHGCTRLIFSSSATVYGAGSAVPFTEDSPIGECTNPYGWTKCMIEQILTDAARADGTLSVLLLRYFNPVGAHESGLLGEMPSGTPTNLMPYLTQTAAGIRRELSIFGRDWPTRDGTGVRDYIHVTDLARGHLRALEYAMKTRGTEIFNLGTGRGVSVLELVETFMAVTGRQVPYRFAPRRAGDVAECWADVSKAARVLGWRAKKTLEDMCRDAWRWQQRCGGQGGEGAAG